MTGVANADVKQHTHVVASEADKACWLATNLPLFVDEGERGAGEGVREEQGVQHARGRGGRGRGGVGNRGGREPKVRRNRGG